MKEKRPDQSNKMTDEKLRKSNNWVLAIEIIGTCLLILVIFLANR
jgi:hypothetical protein